jgi:acyl-CoA thioester hydrolase
LADPGAATPVDLQGAAPGDGWDFSGPHVVELIVQPADIDAYQHVNNSVYLAWLDRAAWSHSGTLGVQLARCLTIRRGMAALRVEIDYVRSAVLGDPIQVGTWITSTDQRLRVERRFQVRHAGTGVTMARARTDYVCINLDSGRAARMPEELSQAYRVTAGNPDTPP